VDRQKKKYLDSADANVPVPCRGFHRRDFLLPVQSLSLFFQLLVVVADETEKLLCYSVLPVFLLVVFLLRVFVVERSDEFAHAKKKQTKTTSATKC
jgi:hypothetical protein